jgi:cytochrome c oxidase subunit III
MSPVTAEPPAVHDEHADPRLAHHFNTMEQQAESASLGMWLFLATEILLFGGLFCAYAVFRANHPEIFVYAHHYLSVPLGAVNTVILLVSSFTMALGVWAAAHSRRTLLIVSLALTIACACGFLSIKYVEYREKWQHGLLWGKSYRPHTPEAGAEAHGAASEPAAPGAAVATTTGAPTVPAKAGETSWIVPPVASEPRGLAAADPNQELLTRRSPVRNVQLFFSIYFGMTGLHALHVIAGIGAIAWILARSVRGDFSALYFTPVALVGLYWHVVDLIWIYLFPLLYLIH